MYFTQFIHTVFHDLFILSDINIYPALTQRCGDTVGLALHAKLYIKHFGLHNYEGLNYVTMC